MDVNSCRDKETLLYVFQKTFFENKTLKRYFVQQKHNQEKPLSFIASL